jgi:hypothetical protein
VSTCRAEGNPLLRSRSPMAQETILARGMVTASDEITVGLLDNGETPQVILIRWPAKVTPVQPGASQPGVGQGP